MESKIELKPCPFCGSKARLIRFGTDYLVECTFCDASVCSGDTRERAAAVWNTRNGHFRNCDVGTVDEQIKRHQAYCKDPEMMCGRSGSLVCRKCFAEWYQKPYECLVK